MEKELMVPITWEEEIQPIIKVIGIGGGGCNAVSQMFKQGIRDVDFLICNTDAQALRSSNVPNKLQLGTLLTEGLGTGCNPEQGRKAALESIEQIEHNLRLGRTKMVFVTAGMGGGTGTGATPVIAEVAKNLGMLTIGVVTLPFKDESIETYRRAMDGIQELEKHVDSLIIIENQKIYEIYENLKVFDAFPKIDEVLSRAVKGIAEIITQSGYVNVDFADVKMVMQNSGQALMGTGIASGEGRAIEAVKEAFFSPLLNNFDLKTAKRVLINITSSREYGLEVSELQQIMEYIKEYTGLADNVKRGVVIDDSLGEMISVTVIAAGFKKSPLPNISETWGVGQNRIILDEINFESDHIKIETFTEYSEVENSRSYADHKFNTSIPITVYSDNDLFREYEEEPAIFRREKMKKAEMQ